MRHEHGDRLNEGYEHQHQNHHRIERQAGLGGVLDLDAADGAACEQRRADRRRAQADGQIEDEHCAELYRLHAELSRNRQKDRRQDEDQRTHVHDAAENEAPSR